MVILTVILGATVSILCYVYNILILKQNKMRRKLEIQGIKGPSPSLLLGNIPEMKHIQLLHNSQNVASNGGDDDVAAIVHDWPSRLFPYFYQWRNLYGPTFLYSTGNIQMLFIADLELLKEINLCNSLSLGKPSYLTEERGPLFGKGVLSSSGKIWAHQRKLIAPEFYLDKVKDIVNLMVECTNITIKSWEETISTKGGGSVEIIIDEDLKNLSGDIIAKACFGSSYSEGKEIFSLLRNLQGIMSKSGIFIGIPGLRHIPTKNNRDIWRLEKKIHTVILNAVNNQRTESKHEKNLLQILLETAKNNVDDSTNLPSDTIKADKFIVDNCKTLYFAGHETTATTATWVLMLLAANQDWQTRVRAEVQEILGDGRTLHADMFRSMKNLTMVIQETLRLYPTSSFVARKAYEDIKFKNIVLPKGINVSVPIPMLHYDPQLWGEDVHKFKPERFTDGVLGACKSAQGYMPFGLGTRICLGQNLGMVELKVVLVMILSKFCFSISPAYRHLPAFKLVIQPEFGVNLIVARV